MKMLELFSGSGNMAKAFKRQGFKTCTIDNKYDADIVCDIQRVTADMIIKHFGKPDVIWASPPCTQFSIAAVSTHWKNRMPPQDTELLSHTLRLIMMLQPKRWYIENPMGMMRKLNIMKHLPKKYLTQCQYGNNAMKPTDVWTNDALWMPKSCKNGMSCHDRSPRGSRTGTQGKKNAAERGKLPMALCREIARR